jgi:WD40 repeat protein
MLTTILLTRFLLASGDTQGELSVSSLLSHQTHWCVPYAHQGMITALAWSPDGHLLASGGLDGLVHVWKANTGELLHSFCHGAQVEQLRWSPGSLLVSTSGAHLRVWFVQAGEPVC